MEVPSRGHSRQDCLPGDSTSPVTSGLTVPIVRTPPLCRSPIHEPSAKTIGHRHHRWAPSLRPHRHGETIFSEPSPPLTSQITLLPPRSALGAAPTALATGLARIDRPPPVPPWGASSLASPMGCQDQPELGRPEAAQMNSVP
jgi:hypothetical protein